MYEADKMARVDKKHHHERRASLLATEASSPARKTEQDVISLDEEEMIEVRVNINDSVDSQTADAIDLNKCPSELENMSAEIASNDSSVDVSID